MDIIKCNALLLSVELGSISSAADRLGYTASGVNRMINAIEEELGFAVLARTNKGVAITKDGENILPALYQMRNCNEQIKQISAQIKGSEYGQIRVGTIYSIASAWLPEILMKFQKQYTKIKVDIVEGNREYLKKMLENGMIDVCFFSDGEDADIWIPIKKDAMVVWAPDQPEFARKEVFPIADIEKYPFVYTLHNKYTDTGRLFDKHQIKADIRYYTDDNYTSYRMVEAGLGISVNNELMASNWNGKVKILPLEPACFVTLGLGMNKTVMRMPAVRKFVECVEKATVEEDGFFI